MGNIYLITNLVNDRVYIGQTIKPIEDRFKEHVSESRMMRIKTMPLYHAINKYGVKNFKILLLEKVNKDKMDEREKHYINKYNSFNYGYNATTGGHLKAKRIPYSDKEIIDKYLELKSCRKVGNYFGIDYSSVSSRVRESGIDLYGANTHFGNAFTMKFPSGKTKKFKSYKNGARYLKKIQYPIKANTIESIRKGIERGIKKGRYYNIILSQE